VLSLAFVPARGPLHAPGAGAARGAPAAEVTAGTAPVRWGRLVPLGATLERPRVGGAGGASGLEDEDRGGGGDGEELLRPAGGDGDDGREREFAMNAARVYQALREQLPVMFSRGMDPTIFENLICVSDQDTSVTVTRDVYLNVLRTARLVSGLLRMEPHVVLEKMEFDEARATFECRVTFTVDQRRDSGILYYRLSAAGLICEHRYDRHLPHKGDAASVLIAAPWAGAVPCGLATSLLLEDDAFA